MATQKNKLEEVIHLYLGCEVQVRGDIEKLIGVESDGAVITFSGRYGRRIWGAKEVKPLLRQLSDITEEEWIKCFELAMGIFEQSIDYKLKKTASTEILITLGKMQFVFGCHGCYTNDVRIGSGVCFYLKTFLIKEDLSVGYKGIESSESGFNDMEKKEVQNINHIFQYLLSKGFDLFSLIETGQAIDKNTLKETKN